MPVIDNSSLLYCLQALEKAIEYNKFLSTSETVDVEDFEEINYLYEQTIRELAVIYEEGYRKGENFFPLSEIIKNKSLYSDELIDEPQKDDLK